MTSGPRITREYIGQVGEAKVRRTLVRVIVVYRPIEKEDDVGTLWTDLDLDFTAATFPSCTNSEKCDLTNNRFSGAIFGDHACFEDADFGDRGWWDHVTFGDCAKFDGATFKGDAIFGGATFGHRASFGGVKFGDRALLSNTVFGNDARRSWRDLVLRHHSVKPHSATGPRSGMPLSLILERWTY